MWLAYVNDDLSIFSFCYVFGFSTVRPPPPGKFLPIHPPPPWKNLGFATDGTGTVICYMCILGRNNSATLVGTSFFYLALSEPGAEFEFFSC